jgi:hypothetical protein
VLSPHRAPFGTHVRAGGDRVARVQIAIALVAVAFAACDASPREDPPAAVTAVDSETRGLRLAERGAAPGYVLYSPLISDKTYLIDQAGEVVHMWASDRAPAGSVYLLDNGNLLRTEREPDVAVFSGGGQAGRIRERTWDGEVVWDFVFVSDQHLTHHDIERLPNGNVLAIAWEVKTADEAKRAGSAAELVPPAGIWPDMVLELEPQPPDGARIVWEWHSWDHLVQNVDPALPNYGDPAAHLGRIDINGDRRPRESEDEELARLRALGYVADDADPEPLRSDLMHTNAIHYNSELRQIALSVPRFNEIWIIDHSTTTEEAAGSSGGRWGRGGDLLYRWGNPQAYGRGGADAPQRLFGQHDVHWIAPGLPGAGNLLIFNNGLGTEEAGYSNVVEITPPRDASGAYVVPADGAFGPAEPAWVYEAPDRTSFHSNFISGAQRLPNGNTLIDSGAQGRFFEVTPAGEIVWEYWTPYSGAVRMADGSPPHPVEEHQKHAVFRATKIPPDHPALAGRTLQPLRPQPPIETAPFPPKKDAADSKEPASVPQADAPAIPRASSD